MATSKKTVPAAQVKAAAKKPGTSVIAWEQEMKAAAEQVAAAEKPWGSFKSVSTQGGVMKIDDAPVEDNEIRVIVVAAIHENQYYDQPFDSKNPVPPKCYAYSDPAASDLEKSVEEMAPHAESEEPQGADAEETQGQEGGNCNACWANKMGTADVGRGKACKNIRRLALITEDALESADAMAEAEFRFLKVPVMSTKLWGQYVKKLNEDISRPPWGVVTLVKIVPDAASQFLITFKFEELVNFDQDIFDALKQKQREVYEAIVAPYPKLADLQQSQQPQRGARPGGKAKSGKPGAKPAGRKF